MRNSTWVRVLLALCAVASIASPAAATAVSTGSSFAVINSYALGTSAAFGNGVYLVVAARGQANLRGRFIQNGVPVGADFVIQTSANYTHYPRVAFSPDADNGAGAFLVSWNESDLAGGNTSLHVRMVSQAHGGAYGPDVQVSQIPTLWVVGCAIAYSAGSPSGQKKFLVACQAAESGAYNIEAFFIDNNANVVSANLVPVQTAENHRDPSVAYNPVTDQFAIVYSGYGNEPAFVAARFLRADTGQTLVSRLLLYQSTATFITKVVYLAPTNQFLASWVASGGSYDLLINADWSFGGAVTPVSARFGTYDSLGLAYNPVTRTTLLVGQDLADVEDSALEIGLNGLPLTSGFVATNAGTAISGGGNLFPEVAANATGPDWVFSFSHDFLSTMAQVVTGTPACTVTAGTTGATVQYVPSGGSVSLTASQPCSWNATSSASWLTITAGATGSGTSGSITYQAALNTTGKTRTATITVGTNTITVTQPGVNLAAISDFTGDGISDLLARNPTTGQLQPYSVSNLTITPLGSLPNVPSDYMLLGTGDLNGDGYADIVWQQQSNGNLYVWFMQGTTILNTVPLSIPSVAASSGWQVRAIGDLNGDGFADLIWQNSITGGVAVWFMNGATVMSTSWVTLNGNPVMMPASSNWVIVGAGDLNHDGKADIVWQNGVTGGLGAWTMNGSAVQVMQSLTPNFINTDYKIVGVGDVNGDGFADLIWQQQSTGSLWVWCMNGFSASVFQGALMQSGVQAVMPAGWSVIGPG